MRDSSEDDDDDDDETSNSNSKNKVSSKSQALVECRKKDDSRDSVRRVIACVAGAPSTGIIDIVEDLAVHTVHETEANTFHLKAIDTLVIIDGEPTKEPDGNKRLRITVVATQNNKGKMTIQKKSPIQQVVAFEVFDLMAQACSRNANLDSLVEHNEHLKEIFE